MYNLTIGMATGGTIRTETMTSLIGAMDVVKSKGVGIYLNAQIGGYVARNRNEIVEQAKKNGSTHLMFIDNDMEFMPSAIQRLLDHDKDIVGAAYNARPAPGKPLVSTVKMSKDYTSLAISHLEIPSQLFKCYGLGTGFMLIKMSVFKKLKKPYFVAYEDPDGTHHTEDIEFCIRAMKKGFDVWCSPTIKVGHIGTITV